MRKDYRLWTEGALYGWFIRAFAENLGAPKWLVITIGTVGVTWWFWTNFTADRAGHTNGTDA